MLIALPFKLNPTLHLMLLVTGAKSLEYGAAAAFHARQAPSGHLLLSYLNTSLGTRHCQL
jgi:hypothetical protein